jgi:hypothetical protein
MKPTREQLRAAGAQSNRDACRRAGIPRGFRTKAMRRRIAALLARPIEPPR